MIKAPFSLLFLFLATHGIADAPSWPVSSVSSQYRYSQAACAPINNDKFTAKLVAAAMAKGAISQNIGGLVTTTQSLQKNTSEFGVTAVQSEQFSERIEVKSSHKLEKISVIESGEYQIKGEKNFCIWLGIPLLP